jgi:segregation and condensation protein B
MSLKAKLEAVIYAAEEPVTLTQLAILFAADALDYKSAQVAASQEAAEAADQPVLAEGLEYLELRTEDGSLLDQPGFAVLPAVDPEHGTAAEPAAGTEQSAEAGIAEPVEGTAGFETNAAAGASAEASAESDLDAKREARQRDREVKAVLRQLIDELIASCAADDRGVEIREIAGGYRVATKPECHDAVRMFIKSLKPAMKLSLPALETLAVIAYKQPVTAPEVNEIRGVDSSGVFGSLLARKLITTAGRKQVIGRPILYKTTREFLLRFGLKDVSELPSMDEFEKMAASELDEAENAPETAESETDAASSGGLVAVEGGPEFEEKVAADPEEVAVEVAAIVDEALESKDSGEVKAEIDLGPGESAPTDLEPANEEAAPAEPSKAEQAETETNPHE